MTDREAIEYLQRALDESEDICCCTPRGCEVAQQALSALQEREERSKGCTCCRNKGNVGFYIGKGYRCCPMCGRQLKEGTKNEG